MALVAFVHLTAFASVPNGGFKGRGNGRRRGNGAVGSAMPPDLHRPGTLQSRPLNLLEERQIFHGSKQPQANNNRPGLMNTQNLRRQALHRAITAIAPGFPIGRTTWSNSPRYAAHAQPPSGFSPAVNTSSTIPMDPLPIICHCDYLLGYNRRCYHILRTYFLVRDLCNLH